MAGLFITVTTYDSVDLSGRTAILYCIHRKKFEISTPLSSVDISER